MANYIDAQRTTFSKEEELRFRKLLLYLREFFHRFLLLAASIAVCCYLALLCVNHCSEFVNLFLVSSYLIVVVAHYRVMLLFRVSQGYLSHLYLTRVPGFCFAQFLFLGIALLAQEFLLLLGTYSLANRVLTLYVLEFLAGFAELLHCLAPIGECFP